MPHSLDLIARMMFGEQYRSRSSSAHPTGEQYRSHSSSAHPTGEQYRSRSSSAHPIGEQYISHSSSAHPINNQASHKRFAVIPTVLNEALRSSLMHYSVTRYRAVQPLALDRWHACLSVPHLVPSPTARFFGPQARSPVNCIYLYG